MASGKLVRIGEGLFKKLIEIMKQEKERGSENVSFKTASEILSKRIDVAGGIKDVTKSYTSL